MAEEQLHIRFKGICSHVDLGGNGTRKMRTVLIRGNHDDVIEHHQAYVEFNPDDLADGGLPADLTLLTYTRTGEAGLLGRIDFGDTYEIRVNALPGLVEQDRFFKRGVPSLSEILGRTATVKPSLLRADPQKIDKALVTTVFDLPEGSIRAGDPEREITRFGSSVPFQERYLAKWSDFFTTVENRPEVQLLSLTGGKDYTIRFRPTTQMITIGNEPLADIVNLLDGGDAAARAAGHWPMFFTLIDNAPDPVPVPIPKQLSGAGCPNNNLP
ncbi:MAG TPA: hypothetical protein VMU84_01315 [Thermoanaerobaculia bacterium]|nr:hypothetical protein [Thermoanaerobaculia bacterium]